MARPSHRKQDILELERHMIRPETQHAFEHDSVSLMSINELLVSL